MTISTLDSFCTLIILHEVNSVFPFQVPLIFANLYILLLSSPRLGEFYNFIWYNIYIFFHVNENEIKKTLKKN